MMRAYWWAMAVVALGAPNRARKRRNLSPKALLSAYNEAAAIRKAWRTRCWLRRVCRRSTLPALVSLSGHKHSQEAKAAALLKALRSGPNSVNSISTVMTLMPGMAVRSTPKSRWSSSRQGPLGWFLLVFLRARLGAAAAVAVAPSLAGATGGAGWLTTVA